MLLFTTWLRLDKLDVVRYLTMTNAGCASTSSASFDTSRGHTDMRLDKLGVVRYLTMTH